MSLSATNTADKILTVEGETSLPAGSPLTGELLTREGRIMRRARASVSRGKFFLNFDLDRLARLDLYEVKVSFDPEIAPASVRLQTGLWGEAMTGAGVVRISGKSVATRTITVVLAEDVADHDWQGRDFDRLGVSERVQIIGELERWLSDHPQDRSAKLAMARAYIASDIRETEPGSRASGLLQEILAQKLGDRLEQEARKLLAPIEVLGDAAEEQAKKQRAALRLERFRKEKTIIPGRSIGSFVLGSPYRVLKNYLELDKQPKFSDKEGMITIYPRNFPDIDLVLNAKTRRLAVIRTFSRAYRLPEGLGVGSTLLDLQRTYGEDVVPSPEWKYVETGSDGRIVYTGVIEAAGITFKLRREIEPVLGTTRDAVTSISVEFE